MRVKFSAETIIPMTEVLGPEAVKVAAARSVAKYENVQLDILQSIQRQVETREIDLADSEQLEELKQTFGDHEVRVYLAWSRKN